MARLERYQRQMVVWVFCLATSSVGFAQEDASTLRKQVVALKAENRELRNLVSMYQFTLKMQNGVVHESRINEKRTCKLIVARDGWGDCRAEMWLAACGACARNHLYSHFANRCKEPTIMILRDPQGPMAVSHPGLKGEHFVLLNSGDRLWAQVAYQFSHELGHVLCGNRSTQSPQMWFEEAFCESLSLWTMDKMGVTWQTKAPYENWRSYATSLSGYANDVRKRVTEPGDLPAGYMNIAIT